MNVGEVGQSCKTCRFFKHVTSSLDELDEEEGEAGECRRRPPIFTVDETESAHSFAHFPLAREKWWCGQWEGRLVPAAVPDDVPRDFKWWRLRLSARACKAIFRAAYQCLGVTGASLSVAQLCSLSEYDLYSQRNTGRVTMTEIVGWLGMRGLSLSRKVSP
jgi:hypothetical protein